MSKSTEFTPAQRIAILHNKEMAKHHNDLTDFHNGRVDYHNSMAAKARRAGDEAAAREHERYAHSHSNKIQEHEDKAKIHTDNLARYNNGMKTPSERALEQTPRKNPYIALDSLGQKKKIKPIIPSERRPIPKLIANRKKSILKRIIGK